MNSIFTFKKEFGLILVGAIIFTASFLWKDFILDIEDLYFPKNRGLWNRFFFVLIVTIMLVVISISVKGIFGINGTVQNNTFSYDEPIDDDTPDTIE